MSTKFTPTAVWRTRASPGPGLPIGTGSDTSTSGPPDLWKRIALGMSRLLSGMSGHQSECSQNLEVGLTAFGLVAMREIVRPIVEARRQYQLRVPFRKAAACCYTGT